MSFSYLPPSPPAPATVSGGGTSDTLTITQPQYTTSVNGINANAAEVINDTSPPPQSPSASIIISIIVIASAIIVSAFIYLLLRFLSRRQRQAFHLFSATAPEEVLPRDHRNDNVDKDLKSVFDSLPIFTFGSLTGNITVGDCAVCLSKFEAQDQLRLLPLCCHAFHAHCIDTWLASNLTCPLCRSSVNTSDSDELAKILSAENIRNSRNRNGDENGGSFRIEIGSVSRRRSASDSGRRSYSIGSFEYIVDDGYEVSVGSTHRRGQSGISVDKESSIEIPAAAAPPGESLAREVAGGRSWLRDYFDRFGSFSFRSSGRSSSRQSEVVVPVEELDLEAHRMGEEISELFRWLSGV